METASTDQPIDISYTAEHTPTKFHASDAFVRGLMGPVGCVAGDTLIVTERGLIPIASIDQPMRVLSWDEKTSQFRLSPCGGAFPKGRDYLYRVTTQSGEFVAAGHHLTLCEDGEYRRVDILRPGQSLFLCSPDQPLTSEVRVPLSLHEDDQRSIGTAVGFLDRYASLARRCGQRFLTDEDSVPVFAPSRGDARKLSFRLCEDAGEQMGDRLVLLPRRIRPDQCDGRKRTGDCVTRAGHLRSALASHADSSLSSRSVATDRPLMRSETMTVSRQTTRLSSACSCSYGSSTSKRTILKIERLFKRQAFWDMQVLDTNNYVTADGSVHHNSGKTTACVMEMIMRAMNQAPYKGVRRTRWGVIRNTYPELRSTTIKSWLDWIDDRVGTINLAAPITAKVSLPLGDGTRMEMEVLFVSVDRPDDVKKLLSLELTGAWLNEARELSKSTLDQITARVSRYPSQRMGGATWSGVIMDTNPPDDDHWYYRLAEVERPIGYEFFRQPGAMVKQGGAYIPNAEAENVVNHSTGYDYWARLIGGKTEEWIKVYVLGEYGTVIDGKPVYPEFTDSFHVAPEPLEVFRGLPIILGWDFGHTPACVICQISPQGQFRVLEEFQAIDMGIQQFAKDVVKPHLTLHYPNNQINSIGDPAGTAREGNERTCMDYLAEAGIKTLPAKTNDPTARREAVAGYMMRIVNGQPGFLLSPNCQLIRKGMNGGYRYERLKVTGREIYKDAPCKDDFSHIQDALQYAALPMISVTQHRGWKRKPEGSSLAPRPAVAKRRAAWM